MVVSRVINPTQVIRAQTQTRVSIRSTGESGRIALLEVNPEGGSLTANHRSSLQR